MSAAPLLLVAYQCGPGLGSVSQIGWQWFCGMAARRPTCLVTHVRNRAAIEAASDRPADARVIYIDTEWLAGPLYRLAKRLFPRSEHAVFMLSQLDWFAFDASALRRLRRELAAGAPWRLLHLVTPVTLSAATRLHRLGLPLLRGPLNCGLPVPAGFEGLLRSESLGLARLRLLPRLLESLWGSLRHSAAILVATQATREALPRALRPGAQAMLENAVDTQRFAPPAQARPASEVLKVLFVGRLVAVKALPLLLDALAALRTQGRCIELEVIGDGPMREDWQRHARQQGVDGDVRWLGARDAAGVVAAMQRADVFCLPSVRESGGAVLLEAMSCGLPVIGMDFGGPAEIIDTAVGWKLPMPDPQTATAALIQALAEAQDEPVARLARGRHARERMLALHSWSARMDAAERLYGRCSRPALS
ncbi:MAG: glycosyltransferase [Roseateles sp.]